MLHIPLIKSFGTVTIEYKSKINSPRGQSLFWEFLTQVINNASFPIKGHAML